MNVKKEELHRIFSQFKEAEVCPRCGGKLHPKKGSIFGGGLSLSRVADIEICPKCGNDEAMTDWANRKRIREDCFAYSDEQRGRWYIVAEMLKNMDTQEGRKTFIQSMESGVYTGFDVDGGETIIMQEQGVGMEIRTCHKGKENWYECVEIDKDGYPEGVKYLPNEKAKENMPSSPRRLEGE